MNSAAVPAPETRPPRGASFALLLFSGLLLFELEFFAFSAGGRIFHIAIFVGLPLLFSIVTLLIRRSPRFIAYWPAFFSYSIVAVALSLMSLMDGWPAWLGLVPKSPKGMALGKLSDAVAFIVIVVVLTRFFRVSLGSIYLQKGRLLLGLIIGVAGFAIMATFGVLEARSMDISTARVIQWAPWILLFVLSNGLFEELMFRGLFLKKFEPLVGPRLANLLTALIFAIGHGGVKYTADILTFVVVTFIFALVWGYVMQKTDSLWGSALFHAGADTVIIIGLLAGVKI